MLFGMNLQEQYDFVAWHLMRQRRRATVSPWGGGQCVFDDGRGGRCANGALLALEDSRGEARAAWWATHGGYDLWWSLLKAEMTDGEERLHNLLRAVHDAIEPRFWGHALRGVALRLGLVPPGVSHVLDPADENGGLDVAAVLEELGDTRELAEVGS